VSFDERFGETLAEIIDVVSPLAALVREVEDARNLRFELPAWATSTLSFRTDAEDRLDPAGEISFAQNAVPLGLDLERFGGGAPPAGERRLDVRALDTAETVLGAVDVTSRFAPEQFHAWTADQKLSAPAFEEYKAGFRLHGELVAPEAAAEDIEVMFETVLRESDEYLENYAPISVRPLKACVVHPWPASAHGELLAAWGRRGGAQIHAPRRRTSDPSRPGYVELAEPAYSAAGQTSLDGRFVTNDRILAATTYAAAARAASRDPSVTVRPAHMAAVEGE
jgi:hypothetical protein